ncbi:LytR/AlgR family response regulator transcription factor [Alicyclobacillus dauci]|uniref:LytTR family transcriptional regulator n=1 Tax=Alicyclobacillus dauci TaxID=1475485 RepID=A0ABY6Z4G6_9BACL|nr:LytTR family DNA-binding domain-containing protein [Alicyclobacillus dauci]WAH37727.1 LytTR family transcriptional regulator [Alicyclobacillus dauci]
MNDFSLSEQLPEVLRDWLPPSASIAVANHDKYVAYRPGTHDIHIHPGEVVRPGSIAYRVFEEKSRVESEVDSSVFGLSYYGLGYLLRRENGQETALTVILPPQHRTPRPVSFITGHADGLWRPIAVERITYIESAQKKTWLVTEEGTFSTNHTLQELETRLPTLQFVRIHRSYIVNIAFIEAIRRDAHANLHIAMSEPKGCELPVGQSYVSHVRKVLEF